MFFYGRLSKLMLRIFLITGEQQHLEDFTFVRTLTIHILNLLGSQVDNHYKKLLGQLGTIEVCKFFCELNFMRCFISICRVRVTVLIKNMLSRLSFPNITYVKETCNITALF
jgi:hypothetical protein